MFIYFLKMSSVCSQPVASFQIGSPQSPPSIHVFYPETESSSLWIKRITEETVCIHCLRGRDGSLSKIVKPKLGIRFVDCTKWIVNSLCTCVIFSILHFSISSTTVSTNMRHSTWVFYPSSIQTYAWCNGYKWLLTSNIRCISNSSERRGRKQKLLPAA